MKNMLVKIIAAIAFLSMIYVNFLATSLPINNRSTGEISDAYPNLFTPAGFAFAIWGVIYLLLAGYVVYQFVSRSKKNEALFNKINLLFIATSIANISWIFAWHYDFIGVSLVIMLALLFLLIRIADVLRNQSFKSVDKLLVSTPFSVYFGWITVAAIANITVFLVSLGWDGFGVADLVWASIVMLVGAVIGTARMRKDQNIAYGLVLVWAYFAILFKQFSAAGFGGQYPLIIVTVVACLILFGFNIWKIYSERRAINQVL